MTRSYTFTRSNRVYPGDLARIEGRTIKPAREGEPGVFRIPDTAIIEGMSIAWREE